MKDQRAVEQAQKVLSEFKPVTYDIAKFTSAIDAFEGRAVSVGVSCTKTISDFVMSQVEAAKATVEKISSEEKDLQSTLSNIQDARPFEDLTVCAEVVAEGIFSDPCSLIQITEIAKAQPQITQAVETMIQKGKWSVPGYRVRSGNTCCGRPSLITHASANRKSSESSLSCKRATKHSKSGPCRRLSVVVKDNRLRCSGQDKFRV